MGVVTNISRLPARIAGILKTGELKQHQPDSLLAGANKISPNHGIHSNVNEFCRAEILAARTRVGLPESDMVLLDLGPNSFGDFPLSELLKDNYVIGADISVVAMEFAKADLTNEEQERLTLMHTDASLAANEIIQTARNIFSKHPDLTMDMFWEFYNGLEEIAFTRKFPFSDNSIDMVVAISAFSSYVVGACNAAIVDLMWGQYGKQPSWDFLSQKVNYSESRECMGGLINKVFNSLYHRIVKHQLKEINRVLVPGGAAFLCDHAVSIPCFNYDRSFTLYPRDTFRPSDQYLLDIGIKFNSGSALLSAGTRAFDASVIGEDSLHAIAKGISGYITVDQFFFWSFSRMGHYMMDVPSEYRLDTGLLLQKTK